MKPTVVMVRAIKSAVFIYSSEYSRLLLDINRRPEQNQTMWKPLIAGFALAAAGRAQTGMEGTWQGTLDAGAMKLRIGLHVSKDAGGWTSTFDSIDQGARGIPVKVTTVSGQTLHFEMPAMAVKFDGTLSADGTQIAGTFTQGVEIPMVFKRVEKVETLNRPQTPKAPFPYK